MFHTRMSSRVRLLACAAIAIIALGRAGQGGPVSSANFIYVLGQATTGAQNSNLTTSFGRIDIASGTYSPIVSAVTGGTTAANLAWNPTIQAFYMQSPNQASNAKVFELTTSGSASLVGSLDKAIGGWAYDSSSAALYAYNRTNQSATLGFGTVSTVSGSFTNATGFSGYNMDNLIGGRMALVGSDLFLIEPKTTAANSRIGKISSFSPSASSATWSQVGSSDSLLQHMVLASDGTTLYGLLPNSTSSSDLYTINPSDGTVSFLKSIAPSSGLMPIQYSGAAIIPVPEPAGLALTALVGCGGFRLFRRRKVRNREAGSDAAV